MAEKSTEKLPKGEELVTYTAPAMPWRNDTEIFAAVNGETIRFKRGVPVKIKRKFLEVLENAERQEAASVAYMRAAKEAGGTASANI